MVKVMNNSFTLKLIHKKTHILYLQNVFAEKCKIPFGNIIWNENMHLWDNFRLIKKKYTKKIEKINK
jgi:hypothetical protein